jgi:small subunit ribosomal protein S21
LADEGIQPLIETLGVSKMTQIVVGENEGIESALRRFKRQVSKAGIFPDIKRQRHFETPIEKRKRKALARRRKRRFRY